VGGSLTPECQFWKDFSKQVIGSSACPIIQTRNNLVPNFSLTSTCILLKFTSLIFFLFDEHVLTFNNVGNQYSSCNIFWMFNPLHAQLNPICHLLTLLGVHHIFHVSRVRFNTLKYPSPLGKCDICDSNLRSVTLL